MKLRWVSTLTVGVVAALNVGTTTWALWWRGSDELEAPQSRALWLVLDPGTEVLFELEGPVEPAYYGTRPWKDEYGGTMIPPPVPPDGKYRAGGGLRTRWMGMGIVWVSKTHILYVAPDRPGCLDPLELYPGFQGKPTLDDSGYRVPEATLNIVTKGNPGLEAYGMTPEQAGHDYWWGEGSVRLRIVSMRSRQEAGKDRGVPGGYGSKEIIRNPDGTREEHPLYINPEEETSARGAGR